jgi:hypothetical protein
MHPLQSSRALPSLSTALVGSLPAAGSYCFEQLTHEERSVVVILSDAIASADKNALTQSLHQLQFRTSFIGAEANASSHSALVTNCPGCWPQSKFDETWHQNAVISFGDESLPLLKPVLSHFRASVHIAETAQAFIELIESLSESKNSTGQIANDVTLLPDHHALLIETGPPSGYSTATKCLGRQSSLRVIRARSAYRVRPYSDPLIIELARRHLEMWV